ncbi:DNA binding domain-containing protein, excisionase family [Streptosporangium canum]|uniref:DNA binding domain-containing protein, excisionase family n=1 Tax=Streptosporangium canum TaxID=324952 RepID=A0A1I3UN36_9ACTN|nr:DNA binding domain-containing protein, excisionase family [Streptosporangium canum]
MRLPERATMTVTETARILGIHRDTAYDAVRRGDLPAIRVGRAILVPTALLAAMLGLPAPGAGDVAPP